MKFSKHSKTHGPHRRNEKSECQECRCKIDKSLNRGTCIKFESRKICVAGNQCDSSDFDFHNAEHKELPVIKICCDEGRDDCQQSRPKGTPASFGTTVTTLTILLILSILFRRVTVNVVVFGIARCAFTCYCVQLFRERLSEKVHAIIPKGIVGCFEFTVVQRSLRE